MGRGRSRALWLSAVAVVSALAGGLAPRGSRPLRSPPVPTSTVVTGTGLSGPPRQRWLNTERYELRCGVVHLSLFDFRKICTETLLWLSPCAVDADMPFTEAERRRMRPDDKCEVRETGASAETQDVPGALATLMRAWVFSSPFAGERSCPSYEARAFTRLTRGPIAWFERLARDATPAGQLYGLCGLRSRQSLRYNWLARHIAQSPRRVLVLDGCEPRVLTLRDAIANLERSNHGRNTKRWDEKDGSRPFETDICASLEGGSSYDRTRCDHE